MKVNLPTTPHDGMVFEHVFLVHKTKKVKKKNLHGGPKQQ